MATPHNVAATWRLHALAERIVDDLAQLDGFATMRERDDWRPFSAGMIERLRGALCDLTDAELVLLRAACREQRSLAEPD